MNAYEIMYVIRPEQEIVEGVILKFNDLITSNGGLVEKPERWGERKMPYAIQNYENGIYVLVAFRASKKCVLKLHEAMKFTKEVLRHIIIRKEVC